jgi:hypothetical protein
MTATAAQVRQLRRMVNEPVATSDYDDEDIKDYIERYPHIDERGEQPYTWDTSTTPPSQDANTGWIPTYDLHAAAADVWEEKAAVVAQDFAFNADGGNYQRNQVYEQYMAQARHHRARRTAKTAQLFKWPDEDTNNSRPEWIGNLAETDD